MIATARAGGSRRFRSAATSSFSVTRSEASTPSSEALTKMTDEERNVSFHGKKVGPRAAIVAAGPIANFILAIVIFATLFTFFGKPNQSARVDSVQESSAAATAGFKSGDVVTAIDGKAIENFTDMQRIVSSSAGVPMTFTVKRTDGVVTLQATPELREVKDNFGNTHQMGVLGITRATSPEDAASVQRVDPATAVWLGVKETWFVVDQTLSYIGKVLVGRASTDQIGGPVRDRPDLGTGRDPWSGASHPSRRSAFGLNRPAEPVSGAAFGWRAPFVLCGRGAQGQSDIGSFAGVRLQGWIGADSDVGSLYVLQ